MHSCDMISISRNSGSCLEWMCVIAKSCLYSFCTRTAVVARFDLFQSILHRSAIWIDIHVSIQMALLPIARESTTDNLGNSNFIKKTS